MPAEASTAAVPERWRTQWHIRRYGFHGLSVQWASEQVRVRRLVVCHLGGGCSVSAVLDGRSVDTTMGFSPARGRRDGDALGLARPGSDPLPVAARGRKRRRDRAGARARVRAARAVGALGGRGGSRALGRAGRAAARSTSTAIASPVRSGRCRWRSGGLDAIVFSGGVGEGSALVRARGVRAPRLPRCRARATSSTPLPRPTRRLRRPTPPCGSSSSVRARTWSRRARCVTCWQRRPSRPTSPGRSRRRLRGACRTRGTASRRSRPRRSA